MPSTRFFLNIHDCLLNIQRLFLNIQPVLLNIQLPLLNIHPLTPDSASKSRPSQAALLFIDSLR